MRGHRPERGHFVKGLYFLLGVCALGSIVAAFWAGWTAGARRATTGRIRSLGLTRNTLRLYREAAAILNRLHGEHDLHGVIAGDSLSPETSTKVAHWVAAHRREESP